MAKLEDVIKANTRANQPLATAVAVGTLYYVTDEGELERSNGTSWVQVGLSETGHDTLDHTGLTGVGGGAATFVGASVYADATQSISNATYTAVAFNQEDYDTDAFHDVVTNNSRLTVPTTAKYLVTTVIGFAANATGQRVIRFRKNGTTYIRGHAGPDGGSQAPAVNLSSVVALTAADYIEVMAYQNSGGSLSIGSASSDSYAFCTITKLG